MQKTDRSLLMYILLTIVTCGIYGLYFLYALARDVNDMCDHEDGHHTAGLLKYFLLTLVTCGIYSFYWNYKLGNRLQSNCNERYGLNIQENGTSVLLWMLLGTFVCGIFSLIGMNIIINNTNALAAAFNEEMAAKAN